jgi:DNA mismatch repair protein MutS2
VRLESGTVGTVVEQRSDEKTVVQVGSLKVVVNSASLTPAEALSRGAAESREPPARPPFRPPAPERNEGYEVDLRGLTGDEAEQSVLSALDAAVLAEHPYLRIIHGKGTGVVRERVQRIVAHDRRVRRHAFAPANQGGTGVTVVELEG